LKEEIEKRLGFREKNRINVGLRTLCTGFTHPYTTGFTPLTPWASHSNTQEHPQEKVFNYSLSILFIELSLFI